jgi:hypothetical protein
VIFNEENIIREDDREWLRVGSGQLRKEGPVRTEK